MSNVLDDLFTAKTPSVPYALTFTDMSPLPNQPSVNFATGVMTYEHILGPGGNHEVVQFSRYITKYADHNLTMWHGQGVNFKPSTMKHVAWPNELELVKGFSGYYFRYFDKTNPASSGDLTSLEITAGGGFPGFPELRSVVIVSKYWLGVAVLVLGLPNYEG